MKKDDKDNQDVIDYGRTAGRQNTVEEDGKPVTGELTPAVLMFGILIGIAFFAVLIWGFIVVFGT